MLPSHVHVHVHVHVQSKKLRMLQVNIFEIEQVRNLFFSGLFDIKMTSYES